jgi:hypothetical protein
MLSNDSVWCRFQTLQYYSLDVSFFKSGCPGLDSHSIHTFWLWFALPLPVLSTENHQSFRLVNFLPLQYYSLDVSFFKSGLDSHLLDLLWNKYWVNTLSASPLALYAEQSSACRMHFSYFAVLQP